MIISWIYDVWQALNSSMIALQANLLANPRVYTGLTLWNLKILQVLNNSYTILDYPSPLVVINPWDYQLSPYSNMNMKNDMNYTITTIYENRVSEKNSMQFEQYLRALTDEIVDRINNDKIVRWICADMTMWVRFWWNDDNNQIRHSIITLSFSKLTNQF